MSKRALIVGVGDYNRGILPLESPPRDVEGLSELLADPRCGFTVIPLINPGMLEFRKQLESVICSEADETILIFFSGHGLLGDNDRLYLAAKDTDRDALRATAVDLTYIRELIDSAHAQQIVVILDCCYSGASLTEFKGDPVHTLKTGLGTGHGKYLLCASTAFQLAMGTTDEGYSLFTKWMIHGIESGEADLKNQSVVTVDQLALYLRAKVTEERPEQVPQGFAFGMSPGDIVIANVESTNPSQVSEECEIEFLTPAVDCFLNGSIIPLIGPGVFGSGRLGAFEISKRLRQVAHIMEGASETLATTCEHVVQKTNQRFMFLNYLRTVLGDRSDTSEATDVHKLLMGCSEPLFVVSATWDWVLEASLEKADRSYTLVAHVLDSPGRQHDGKIIKLRRSRDESGKWNSEVELCLADKLLLDMNKETVIYKILGSPFLNSFLPDEFAMCDSVVATEADHLTFLGRLENQHMQVPTDFSLPLSFTPVIFMGYALDIWQYRLVLSVFKKSLHNSYSVRESTTEIEQLWWKRLGSDMIALDTNQFAQSVSTARDELKT